MYAMIVVLIEMWAVSVIPSIMYGSISVVQKMRQFMKMLEDLGSRIATAESTTAAWTVPSTAAKACEEMQHLQRMRDMLTTAGALLDDCNEQRR